MSLATARETRREERGPRRDRRPTGATLEAPVWILPGQPDDVVTLHFGHGRTRAGRVGNGTGVNAYRLRAAAGLWLATASVQKAGGTTELATTQQHFNMEGRHLVRTGTFEEYRKDPEFARRDRRGSRRSASIPGSSTTGTRGASR